MGKNIIICCDGTGNQYGKKNSNVVKLYSILPRNENTQISFYDPGVGTFSDVSFPIHSIKKQWDFFQNTVGLMFGHGLQKNITEAYSYLMENYEPEDKIYLFGFSRGAYTVRALAGFIHMCGLLDKDAQNLIPYAYKLYKDKNFDLTRNFKKTFSRDCKFHFMGIWDTVTSIGWVFRRKTLPYTTKNSSIKTIRHAISIDERRAYFRQNLCKKDKNEIKQVWFAGVHSDIGGGYVEKESGLAKITLQWIVQEAKKNGLKIDEKKYERVVLGLDSNNTFASPDHKGQIHKSLTFFWCLLEFLPKNKTLKWWSFSIPLGRRRTIKEGSIIHQSVFDKMKDDDKYKPKRLPKNSTTEPYHSKE